MTQGVGRRSCAVVLAALLLFVASCSTDENAAVSEVLDGYAAALGARDTVAAAGYTSSPDSASEVIGRTLRDMRPERIEVTAHNVQRYSGGNATFDLTTRWNFGDGRDWEYTTSGSASELSIGWRLSWDPAIVAPGLSNETSIRQIRTDARAPRVFGADDDDLMFAGTVHRVSVDPNRTQNLNDSLNRVAQIVAPVAPLVTAARLRSRAEANPGQPVPVVDLRADDFAVLEDRLTAIPGLRHTAAQDLLISNRQLFSPLFDGIKGAWQANRDATAGWAVQLVTAGQPPTQVVGYQGPPGPDLRATMNPDTQLAAENAVVQLGQPAAMVVISVDSGAVLAAAQNTQASAVAEDWALTGLSTTGPVLSSLYGAVNDAAGDDTARQTELLSPLGLGTDFEMVGVDTVTAELPGVDGRERAELSARTVSASPFGMAVFAAAVAKGETTAPFAVHGQVSDPSAPIGPVDPDLLTEVRDAMERTVTTGDASGLESTGVRALVGTNGPQGPGWFIGHTDDEAFAVMVTGTRSGAGALQVAGAYLEQ